MLEKWYGLFPENPYARISALIPLALLFSFIIVPGLLQYTYGYRYNPAVANQFSYNLSIINDNIHDGTLFVFEDYDFYKILERTRNLRVINTLEKEEPKIAFLGVPKDLDEKYVLSRIYTSQMRENSDIIYVYTVKEGE